MSDFIIWDCETGPRDDAKDFCVEPKDGRSKSIAAQLDDAALSAITGRIVVIGLLLPEHQTPVYYEGAEKDLLSEFWTYYTAQRLKDATMQWVGFNSDSFDLPFVVRRSWANGLKVPHVFDDRGYPLHHFRDLRDVWACGDRQAKGSLGVICKLFGLGEKNGDGKDFAADYAKNREKALAYLENDLQLTKRLADLILTPTRYAKETKTKQDTLP